jgi:hypothetical protein
MGFGRGARPAVHLRKATSAAIGRGLTVSLKALRRQRFIHELVWRSL